MPALQQAAGAVPWDQLVPLAALCALGPYVPRCPVFCRRNPPDASSCAAVFFAGVFLLPPLLAALLPACGVLLGPRLPVGRIWQALRLAGAAAAAAWCFQWLTGGVPPSDDMVGALLPSAAAVGVFALVHGALAGRPRLPDSLRTMAGLHGLLAAALWDGLLGMVAALLVLLPAYVSCWVLARSRQVIAAQRATVRALVEAVELKDPYTRGHSERVGRAAAMIADELGLHPEYAEALCTAGMLHDIGKLGVPTPTLRKEGSLTSEEWQQIRRHPECGYDILRGVPFLRDARDAVLHHHERLDGTGYPGALAGARIPEAARIVAVADAFDAMTSTRSYRPARPVDAALVELRRCAGTQFDPRAVRALCQALERYGWPYHERGVEQRGNVPAPRATVPAAPFAPLSPLVPLPPADPVDPAGLTGPVEAPGPGDSAGAACSEPVPRRERDERPGCAKRSGRPRRER